MNISEDKEQHGEKVEVKIDIEKILSASLKKILDDQNEFFEMMCFVQENDKQFVAVSKNIMKLPLSDQLIFYRQYKRLIQVAMMLYDKHRDRIEEESK